MNAPIRADLLAGIHRISMAEYLADPCPVPSLSSGCAHTLLTDCPRLAYHYHPRLGGRKSSRSNASEMGSTAHDLLLGGEGKICEIRPEDYPAKSSGEIPTGWTNASIRAARDQAIANGLTPMLSGELAGARAMAKAARAFIAQSEIPRVFDHGESEVTVIGRDGEAFLRTRHDWLNLRGGIALSYKTTTGKAHPDVFRRIVDSMGYDFSLMFYERTLLLADASLNGIRSVMLVQEQHAPYLCSLIELAPAKAEIQRAQVRRAIALWQRCLERNEWPGYGGAVARLEPKPWDLAEEEARMVADEMAAMEVA